MTISIIIPVYNIENYIIRCLESIINQDFALDEYEIIIVNDGSSDQSLLKIEEFTKQYKNYSIKIYSKPNGGLSSARNFGLEKAQGDYIWFVDGDDWVSKESLYEIKDYIKKHPRLDILEFDYELAIDTSEGIKYEYSGNPDAVSESVETGRNFLEDHEYSLGVTVKIFNREFLINHNFTFPEGKYSEDNLFSLRTLLEAQEVLKVKKIYYYYYQRQNSITKTKTSEHLQKYYSDIYCNIKEMKALAKNESHKIQYTIDRMINFFILLMMLDLFRNKKYDLMKYFGKKLKNDHFYPIKEVNVSYISKKFIALRFFVNLYIKFI